MNKIFIYVQSEKLISFLRTISQNESFPCEFFCLKSGVKFCQEAQNFFIVHNFPSKIIPNVKYIICSKNPAELDKSKFDIIFDLWPEPLTPALLKLCFRNLIMKIKALNHSEELKYQKRILEMAQQDYLTGLATRWYLQEYAEARQNEANITCIYFDLDHFKSINDTYGHQEGDRALAATGEMMQQEFPDGFCARMGGDEFMIVIPAKISAQNIEHRVNAFLKTLTDYYSSVKTMQKLSVSAGISQKLEGESKSIDILIHESDTALYEAKKSGRACCKIYNPSMENRAENQQPQSINYYLIDYENVKNQGFNGIQELTGKNIICIFYSKNAPGNINLDLLSCITQSKADIMFRKVEVGSKNALDFQLSSYLGEIIAENNNNCNYFIISRDRGFNSLIPFWKERNVNVKIIIDLTGKISVQELDELKIKLANILNYNNIENNQEMIDTITEILANNTTKSAVSNALNKKFRNSTQAGHIYRAVKRLIFS